MSFTIKFHSMLIAAAISVSTLLAPTTVLADQSRAMPASPDTSFVRHVDFKHHKRFRRGHSSRYHSRYGNSRYGHNRYGYRKGFRNSRRHFGYRSGRGFHRGGIGLSIRIGKGFSFGYGGHRGYRY